jgi:hypothetical protein
MFDFLKRWLSHPPRHYWTAHRFHGGGVITTPDIMSEEEAVHWIATVIKGEVAYIDREHGFIFYRPKE